MATMWPDTNLSVASSLQNPLLERSDTGPEDDLLLPIIHYGLLKFNFLKFSTGGSSRVYFGKLKMVSVAIKVLVCFDLDVHKIKEFYQEALVLSKLKHERVVGCVGVTIIPPSLGTVMEYCCNGSLYSFLYEGIRSHSTSSFSERSSRSTSIVNRTTEMSLFMPPIENEVEIQMMLDAATALEFIHSKGYIHCDVKSLNYLVTEVVH